MGLRDLILQDNFFLSIIFSFKPSNGIFGNFFVDNQLWDVFKYQVH